MPGITDRVSRRRAQSHAQAHKTACLRRTVRPVQARKLARFRGDDGARGRARRTQLAESSTMICGSSIEPSKSKRTTACTADGCERQPCEKCSHQGRPSVACRVQDQRATTAHRCVNASDLRAPARCLSALARSAAQWSRWPRICWRRVIDHAIGHRRVRVRDAQRMSRHTWRG